MRYFLRDKTFIIRGAFTAIRSDHGDRTGDEEIIHTSTVITAQFPNTNTNTNTNQDQKSFFQSILRKNGYDTDTVHFAVTAPVRQFRVFAYDGIMVFIHAQPLGQQEQPGPLTIIVTSRDHLPREGLRALLRTAEEAVEKAPISLGMPASDPKIYSVLVCCEEMEESPDMDERLERAQMLISETLSYGIPETWNPQETESQRTPPFYIHSSIGGERWTRWNPDGCPYYPCHPSCTNQRCDFCYCPLYPCEDESQGKWLERENGGKIWSCEGCTLVHEPFVADYLTLYPEASVKDLKNIQKNEE